MSDWVFERTISADTPDTDLPRQVPAEIWRYAQAFLRLRRPMLRFFWRDDKHWLDVQFGRDPRASLSGQGQEYVRVIVSRTEMPRGITVRELDVLTLVALGHTNSGIAERLGTSARTVSSQLERLLEKLDQASRGGLAALAVDLGLLRLPFPGGLPETGGIGVAELELALHAQLDPGRALIRDGLSDRVPIRLGVVVPSGAGTDSAQTLNGARLAVDEINALGGIGGRRIEAVVETVEMFDWRSVERGLMRLIDADVDAIITSYVSAEHPQFLDVIADYGKPFLHTATFEADVQRTELEPWRYGMVFQTCASETYYGPGMLRVLEHLEAAELWVPRTRRVVCLEMPSVSMHLATPSFVEFATSRGWEVAATVETPVGATDWARTIADVDAHEPDVLLVANYVESELIAFQRAFSAHPLSALVYCIYSPSIPSYLRELGPQANGVMWSTTTGTYDDDLGRRFRDQYARKYGEDPGWSQAGAVYDQVRMLAAAWSSVDPRNVKDVVQYLRRWPYRGVNGVYYFGETGHAPRLYPDTTSDAALSQAHLVYQIQDEAHVLLHPEPFGHLAQFQLPQWMSHAE
ncbi:ABC transporter substrate-binding protein [Leucobacter sp. W1153]|uniref:ABC transporter substrate-binding protein n=1 Tax=Leucobacter sp. W1153 TaxID=3439064 RepID=UPI003F2F2C8B